MWLKNVVGSIMAPHQSIYVSIPETYEYVTLHAKGVWLNCEPRDEEILLDYPGGPN